MEKNHFFGKELLSVLFVFIGILLVVSCPKPESSSGTVPGAPQKLQAIARSTSVTVSWQAPSESTDDITAYTLYYSTASITDLAAIGVKKKEAGTALTVDVTGLTNDTLYYFVVTATNDASEGEKSAEATATPVANKVPGAPVNLKITEGENKATALCQNSCHMI